MMYQTLPSSGENFLVAARSLCEQKSSEQRIISSSTLFFAAVEWGLSAHPDRLPPASFINLAQMIHRYAWTAYQRQREAFFANAAPTINFATSHEAGPSRSVAGALATLSQPDPSAEDIIWAVLLTVGDPNHRGGPFHRRFGRLETLVFDDYPAALLRKTPDDPLRSSIKLRNRLTYQSMWLCQYRRTNGVSLDHQLVPGQIIEWRKLPKEARDAAHDEVDANMVAVWRTVDGSEYTEGPPSRGGIVGWGEIITSDLAETDAQPFEVASEEAVVDSESADAEEAAFPESQGDTFFRIRIVHAFPDTPIPRDRILSLLGQAKAAWPYRTSFARLNEPVQALFARLVSFEPSPTSAEPYDLKRIIPDNPETTCDHLGRGALAFAIATLINRVWDEQRADKRAGEVDNGTTFVLHIDSPWGAGKTTFANFIAHTLNPNHFDISLKAEFDSNSLFHELSDKISQSWSADWQERKWIPVTFNAWEHQHVSPPWWDFYQTTRLQWIKALPPLRRTWHRFSEMMWRVLSPTVRNRIYVFLAVGTAIALGAIFGGIDGSSKEVPPGWQVILLIFGGGSVVALFNSVRVGLTEVISSVSQSTDPENLGGTDPLERFRRHYQRRLQQFDRPLLIVIDDLDRCNPAYVVELMRGILTIFNSSRVVFLILGDKSWIEHCFVSAYPDMAKFEANADRSFGSRFTEKLIQLSFILPAVEPVYRRRYLQSLLGSIGNATAAAPTVEARRLIDDARNFLKRGETSARINDIAEELVAHATDILGRSGLTSEIEAVKRVINAEAVYNTIARDDTRQEIEHGLFEFSDLLPDNPRRVKRLINMISIYQASAQLANSIRPGSDDWKTLVRWIILMSEFPELWEILARQPDLMELRKGPPSEETAAAAAVRKAIAQFDEFCTREPCRNIVFKEGGRPGEAAFTTEELRWLSMLTPVN